MTILTSSQVSLGDLLCEAKSWAIGFFWLGLGAGVAGWAMYAVAFVLGLVR